MATILGCIADDFTGATDLAGLLARSGHPISLRIGVPDQPPNEAPGDTPQDAAAFEVIALKSRTAPVADAVAESRRALAWLRAAGAQQVFWKYCSTFDSTPEGNIGPVAEALMADLGTAQTIYCPAFPENGRAVFMGNLFVGQHPLAESPMKDHPLTPMRDSNLMRLLAPQVTGTVGLVDRLTVAEGPDAVRAALAEHAANKVAHVVVDAVAEADLHTIAAACHTMPLLTGGSALAMPLPALLAADPPAPQARTHAIEDAAMILSGSCSAMTRAQVGHYAALGPSRLLDPVALARDGVQCARDWLAAQAPTSAPMLYTSAEPADVQAAQAALGPDRAAQIVEDALARLALAGRDMGLRRIIVAGGEISGAVTHALGVTRLDIGTEIAPGVPWTFCTSGGHAMALALKSGNFGAETFFSDALTHLREAT
ncbi:3-oxo-tetronate kinase [Gymnodinialimonas ulvae]|uniref:3-oxo-tetronate kinase n=1 Tax=Gymnodinialimonas ulvae TaxID=3126504 RepID=UPI0030B0E752